MDTNTLKIFSLPKEVKKISVGLGWDMLKEEDNLQARFLQGEAVDLDLSCLLIDDHKKIVDTVSYRQLLSKFGGVVHSGDNETGQGDGDDEVITVELNQLPSYIQTLIFTVTAFSGQSFQDIANAFCRVVDMSHNQELAMYSLSCNGIHTAVIALKVFRQGAEWAVQYLGDTADGHSAEALLPQIIKYL
jgi:tellurium resistance protein TerZ